MDPSLLILLILLVLAVSAAVVFTSARKAQDGPDLAAPLQVLVQAVQQNQSRIDVLYEKINQLATSQSSAQDQLVTIGSGLARTGAAAESLVTTTNSIRDELSSAKSDLTALQAQARARQDIERGTAESIRRLEAVIAGTQSKGSAGENILELMFSKLPAEWQIRNFTVGNKTVEFGLRLPNNLILPIDSKWAATHLLEQFVGCQDADEKRAIKAKVEKAVLDKAKEVQKYIDPHQTVNFGVAVVPDAVYELCCGVLTEAFKLRVMLVSHSMFMPYLLLVVESALKLGQSVDEAKLKTYLETAQHNITALQTLVERRLSRVMTMLDNSRTEMRVHLSKLSGGLAGLHAGGSERVSAGADGILPGALGEAGPLDLAPPGAEIL